MLDVNLIRENPEKVKEGIALKHADPKLVDKFLRFDEEWRGKTAALDQLKREQNILNKEIGASAKKEDLLGKAQILKKRLAEITEELNTVAKKRDDILNRLPNLPFDDVPHGKDEEENKVVSEVGERPKFNFTPKDSLSIGEDLGLIDVKRAADISGSRFGYLMREGVLMEFALGRLVFDTVLKRGFVPVLPPVMIKPDVYEGIGRLAADQRDDRFYLEKDDLFLVGSAEHTLAPLHMNEVLKEEELPRRYVGFSTCFRREAGSYGKDTKGILRVHQFDKYEFFSFTTPDRSEKEIHFLLGIQEELMQALKLPYRVVEICTGDMGWTDARQFDVEAWFPSEEKYRETHSCSNTTDFQMRGINTKYKNKKGEKQFVHALNATGFSQRPILAILENYQTKKGTVKIPEALQKYIGKEEIK